MKVRKSAAPFYAVAVIWLAYALLFPLYRVSHFLIVGVISAVAFLLLTALCAKTGVPEAEKTEKAQEKPKEESTGNADLDRMLKDGRLAIAEMKRLDESIEDAAVSADIVRLQQVSEKIFARVKEEPAKLPQIRRFMDYYLPTTLKLLNAYDRASSAGISGENVDATKAKVSGMMKTIVTAFEKQLDALYGTEALDISTDITVLENMMAREGLTGGDVLHKTAQENPVTDPDPSLDIRNAGAQTQPPEGESSVDAGNGITLEL